MFRFRLSVIVAVVSALMLGVALPALALPGDVDQTFGTLGHAMFDFPNNDNVGGIDRQSTGKIVVAGTDAIDWFEVVRFSADGELDPTFGIGGYGHVPVTGVGSNLEVADIAIQANDRILVVGWMFSAAGLDRMVVARFRAGGAIDASFGNDGVRKVGFSQGDAYAYGVALQSDGRIVVVGQIDPVGASSKVSVVRLRRDVRRDGSLDPTFGNGGRRVIRILDSNLGYGAAFDVRVTPRDRLVLGGVNYVTGDDRTMAMRLFPGGKLDRSFGGNGSVTLNVRPGESDEASGVALSGGRIVLAVRGPIATRADAVRLTGGGARDQMFGGDGIASSAVPGFFVSQVVVQQGGAVIVTDRIDGKLVRFTPGGNLDAGFGTAGVAFDPDGPVGDSWPTIELQAGKILLAGETDQGVAIVSRFLGS